MVLTARLRAPADSATHVDSATHAEHGTPASSSSSSNSIVSFTLGVVDDALESLAKKGYLTPGPDAPAIPGAPRPPPIPTEKSITTTQFSYPDWRAVVLAALASFLLIFASRLLCHVYNKPGYLFLHLFFVCSVVCVALQFPVVEENPANEVPNSRQIKIGFPALPFLLCFVLGSSLGNSIGRIATLNWTRATSTLPLGLCAAGFSALCVGFSAHLAWVETFEDSEEGILWRRGRGTTPRVSYQWGTAVHHAIAIGLAVKCGALVFVAGLVAQLKQTKRIPDLRGHAVWDMGSASAWRKRGRVFGDVMCVLAVWAELVPGYYRLVAHSDDNPKAHNSIVPPRYYRRVAHSDDNPKAHNSIVPPRYYRLVAHTDDNPKAHNSILFHLGPSFILFLIALFGAAIGFNVGMAADTPLFLITASFLTGVLAVGTFATGLFSVSSFGRSVVPGALGASGSLVCFGGGVVFVNAGFIGWFCCRVLKTSVVRALKLWPLGGSPASGTSTGNSATAERTSSPTNEGEVSPSDTVTDEEVVGWNAADDTSTRLLSAAAVVFIALLAVFPPSPNVYIVNFFFGIALGFIAITMLFSPTIWPPPGGTSAEARAGVESSSPAGTASTPDGTSPDDESSAVRPRPLHRVAPVLAASIGVGGMVCAIAAVPGMMNRNHTFGAGKHWFAAIGCISGGAACFFSWAVGGRGLEGVRE